MDWIRRSQMKKNRPINYTIKTRRQVTAAEKQSYIQIAETYQLKLRKQLSLQQQIQGNLSLTQRNRQPQPETSAEENNSTTTPGTPAYEPLDTSAENNITEEESSEVENSENNFMATGFSIPKFNGSESPVIWLSKLDA